MDLHEHTALGQFDAMIELLTDIAKMLDRQASRDGIAFKIAADTVAVHLLEANRFRHLATVYNDSSATLYLKLGAQANADDWTVKLNPNDYYETPAGYTGPLSASWSAANGQARVTELA
jgi:hypothetical protein